MILPRLERREQLRPRDFMLIARFEVLDRHPTLRELLAQNLRDKHDPILDEHQGSFLRFEPFESERRRSG